MTALYCYTLKFSFSMSVSAFRVRFRFPRPFPAFPYAIDCAGMLDVAVRYCDGVWKWVVSGDWWVTLFISHLSTAFSDYVYLSTKIDDISEGCCNCSVCLSVNQHLTSRASVRLEKCCHMLNGWRTSKNICRDFSETPPLQRSSTFCIVWLSVQSAIFFYGDSTHAHYSILPRGWDWAAIFPSLVLEGPETLTWSLLPVAKTTATRHVGLWRLQASRLVSLWSEKRPPF